MKTPLVLGLASLAVLAFACAPRARGGERSESASRSGTSGASGQARSATATEPRIESALAVDAADAHAGVRFAFSVTNAGGGKVEMKFPSGQTHEVIVLDTLGREVWRWSRGRMFTPLLQNKILRNADTLAYDERWADAPKGRYVAVARLASDNYPIEERTPFIVR